MSSAGEKGVWVMTCVDVTIVFSIVFDVFLAAFAFLSQARTRETPEVSD